MSRKRIKYVKFLPVIIILITFSVNLSILNKNLSQNSMMASPDTNKSNILHNEELMAVPVIETCEINGSTTGSATLTCDKPDGVEVGDLLVLIPFNDDFSSTDQFIDNKDGWTYVQDAGDINTNCHIGMFWRVADGTEGSSESVSTKSSDEWGMWYLRISGVDTRISGLGTTSSNVVEATGSETLNTGSSIFDITGVITAEDNCLVLYCQVFDGGHGYPFSVSGTGFEEIDDYQTGTTNYSDVSASFGYRNMTSAGASGTATVNASSSFGMAGFQIAFNAYVEFIPANNNSILELWAFLSVLLVIIGILSALSVRSYVLIPRKKRKKLKLQLRTQKFKDIRNIQAIIMTHSESGLPIFSRNYSFLMKGKKTIFSGFIQALTIIGEEIYRNKSKKSDLGESEHSHKFQKIIELDLKYFQCLILDINELRTVLILKKKSSKILKRKLTHFAFAVYQQISKRLENWNNDLKPFEKVIPPLLNQYFDLYYKDFFKLTNREYDIQKVKNQFKLNKYECRILNIAYSISKENSYIKLMNLLEKESGKNEDLIIDALESLIEYKLIYPVNL